MKLGDRMKMYEKIPQQGLTPKVPVIIRVDGRSFHTFTKNMKKPFDSGLSYAMIKSAENVAKEMQGFKLAYVQSDEVTFFLSDMDRIESQGWFGYDIAKLNSITASLMTVNFNHEFKEFCGNYKPIFDARSFNLPKEEVFNVFLWRMKDWERNSLQMYARHYFSHKELNKKNKSQIHEMLHKIGKNWTTDLTFRQKNGTFIYVYEGKIKTIDILTPNYEVVSNYFKYIL